jgi:hypothetical protein
MDKIAIQTMRTIPQLMTNRLRKILDRTEGDVDPATRVHARSKVRLSRNRVLEPHVLNKNVSSEMFTKIIGDQDIFNRTELPKLFVNIDVEFIKSTIECCLIENESVCWKKTYKTSGIWPKRRKKKSARCIGTDVHPRTGIPVHAGTVVLVE